MYIFQNSQNKNFPIKFQKILRKVEITYILFMLLLYVYVIFFFHSNDDEYCTDVTSKEALHVSYRNISIRIHRVSYFFLF